MDSTPLVVKMPKEFEIEAGAKASITLDPKHLYVFDDATGERIRTTS